MDELPHDLEVPAGRDRLGRAHQFRVDISIALSLVPNWIKRALIDKNSDRARGARAEVVERIATAIERRFRVNWIGCDDNDDNAHPPQPFSRLFGDGTLNSPIDTTPAHEEQSKN